MRLAGDYGARMREEGQMPGDGKERRPRKKCERARLALWEVAVLVRLVSGAARWGAVGLALALVVACRPQSGERAGEQSKQRVESAEVAAEEATPTPTSGDETKTKTETETETESETDTDTGVLDEPVLQEGGISYRFIAAIDRAMALERASQQEQGKEPLQEPCAIEWHHNDYPSKDFLSVTLHYVCGIPDLEMKVKYLIYLPDLRVASRSVSSNLAQ